MDIYPHGPLVIRTLKLGELDTNCYFLTDHASKETIVIDPADSAETILEVIAAEQLRPISIILTHGHFDHVLGLLELQLALDLPVFMHPDDQSLLAGAQASAQHWLGHSVDPVPHKTQTLAAGGEFAFGKHVARVLHTPGHTPGSICLELVNADKSIALVTGDTLFKNSIGRTDFSYSKPLQLRESLHKILEFPDELTCYPGHGEPTTVVEARSFLG